MKNEVTKAQFIDYEYVRQSGMTNMFDIKMVKVLSGLDGETITAIMRNYNELDKKYNN